MSYSRSDEENFPDPVRTGLMDRQEFDLLETYAETDPASWRAMMIGLCARSVLLYTSFFKTAPYNSIPQFAADLEPTVLDPSNKNVLMMVARGHLKSSIWVTNDIERRTLLSTVPELPDFAEPRMLLIQQNKPTAVKTVQGVKAELEHNKKIQSVFGDVRRKALEWSKDVLWLRNDAVGTSKEPTLFAVGAESGVTGFHPFTIYGDDVTTYKTGRTPGMRKLIKDWYGLTIRPMKVSSSREIREIWPCTPYFDNELTHDFEKNPAWLRIRKPALNRMPTSSDFERVEKDGRLTGVRITDSGMDLKALWPCPLGTGNCPNTTEHYQQCGEHRSVEYLIFEQYLDEPYRFQLQFQLIRASETDTRFKPDMFRFWTRNRSNHGAANKWNDLEEAAVRYIGYPDELKAKTIANAHFWDFAVGKKKANDRTVGAVGYRTKENDLIVMFHKGRWDPARALQMMSSIAANDPIKRVVRPIVNDANFERTMASIVNAGLLGQDNFVKVIEREKKNQDKDTLIQESGLIPHMMAGKVFFEIEDENAIEEILSFTQGMTHDHDDVADALTGLYEALFPLKRRHKIGYL